MRVSAKWILLILSLVALSEWVRGDDEGAAAAAPSESVKEGEDEGSIAMDTMSDDFEAQLKKGAESYEFQTELSRLMDIIVNSLYRSPDIFVRELISNAADALDRVRFLSISDESVLGTTPELDIYVYFDEEKNQICFRDTGIGMTKLDLIENLGTVAKSGTSNFVEALAEGADISQIGQFGVGFYSAYLVADKVQVISKHNDDDQYVWESSASSEFTVSKDPRGNTLGRGTEVILHLKEGSTDFSTRFHINSALTKHCQFVPFPIFLYIGNHAAEKKIDEIKAPAANDDEPEEVDLDETDDEKKANEQQEEEELKIIPRNDPNFYNRVNNQLPIWMRPKDELEKSDYENLYRAITQHYLPPANYAHFKAEGDVGFTSILFIDSKPHPQQVHEQFYERHPKVKLYIRKVLVSDDIKDMLPQYLSFVSGIVDSDELLLNVNRENLQEIKAMAAIKRKLTRKTLDMLLKMAKQSDEEANNPVEEEEEEEPENGGDSAPKRPKLPPINKYFDFYDNFGRNIRAGMMEEKGYTDKKLSKLLRYKTSKSNGMWRSIDTYKNGMNDWQKKNKLYYAVAESLESCAASPFMDIFFEKDVEVIYVTDSLDAFIFETSGSLDGLTPTNIASVGVSVNDDPDKTTRKKLLKAYKRKYNPLKVYLEDLYRTKYPQIKVRVNDRYGKFPALVYAGPDTYSAHMQKISKYHPMSEGPDEKMAMLNSRTIYLNPRHRIVDKLLEQVVAEGNSDELSSLAWSLYDTATISSGYDISNPEIYGMRMYDMMSGTLGIEDTTLLPKMEVPDDIDEGQEEDEEDNEEDDEEEEDDDDEGEDEILNTETLYGKAAADEEPVGGGGMPQDAHKIDVEVNTGNEL